MEVVHQTDDMNMSTVNLTSTETFGSYSAIVRT